MLTKEQRAQIARENGAKSKGPVTPEGKAKSSRNSLTHGERAEKLAFFTPPHEACICTEDRQKYFSIIDQMLAIYRPINQVSAGLVKEIANARWQITRLQKLITSHWNLALVDAASLPATVAPELAEVQASVRASEKLFGGQNLIGRLNRQIDQLESRIAKLERRIVFVHKNFQSIAPERTEPETVQPVENTEDEQPIYITEDDPKVIAGYKLEFPGRKIVVLPPDAVAQGAEIDDDIPFVPRRVA